jgi:uncharacterized protein (TIGR02118 family)
MIKLTFALVRRSDLTCEAFQSYWFEKHAPLVASVRETLRIRRYVQLHSAAPEISAEIRRSRNAPEQFDGVAQLWWDSFEDLAASASDPEARIAGQKLLEDERRFIDLEKSPLWFGEERVIF